MVASVNANDFTLQSLNTKSPNVGTATAYILLIKAKWCGHCTRYLPEFEKQDIKFPKVKFLVLEATTNEKLLEHWANLANPVFEVHGYPTVVLYDPTGTPVKPIEDRNNLAAVL